MKLWILGTSFVLFLVALPLVSWGTWEDVDAAWYTGLGLMAVAAVLPPLTRFQGKDEKDGDDKKSGGSDDKGGKKSGAKKGDRKKGNGRKGDGKTRGKPGADGDEGRAHGGPMEGTSPGATPRRTSERAKLQKRQAEAATKDKER